MAEICEICIKPLKHWIDPIPGYDEEDVNLCSRCSEKVEKLEEKHGGNKDFEECVKLLRKSRK